MSDRSLIDTYLVAGQFRVEGWLDPYSADFVRAIADIQRGADLGGAVGEIGVHHGKLFLVLMLTRAPGEAAFAIDVFEDQKQNLDGSGMGDRAAFERNLRHWGKGADDIRVIPASSLSLQPDDILRPCGRVRLASIDGGHTAECVRNDLRLIEATLTDDGVIVLDDYFNPEWPGVSTGVAEYLLCGEGALRPFRDQSEQGVLLLPASRCLLSFDDRFLWWVQQVEIQRPVRQRRRRLRRAAGSPRPRRLREGKAQTDPPGALPLCRERVASLRSSGTPTVTGYLN